MRIINVTPKMDALLLGKQGENKSTKFLFDVSGWLEDYPGCSIGLNYRPAKSNVSYPCILMDENNGKKSWLITSSELVNDGDGLTELVCILDEVVEKDKRTWKTKVNKSLGGSGTAPDPWENWEDTFIELAERAEDAAEDAEEAKEAAEEAASIAAHAPIIQNGYWYEWDATTEQYVNTEVKAQGEDGDPGQDATPALITVDYSELTFPVAEGKLCYHSGLLYKANQAIATSEAWTAAHWTQTTIEAEQHALKTEITNASELLDDVTENYGSVEPWEPVTIDVSDKRELTRTNESIDSNINRDGSATTGYTSSDVTDCLSNVFICEKDKTYRLKVTNGNTPAQIAERATIVIASEYTSKNYKINEVFHKTNTSSAEDIFEFTPSVGGHVFFNLDANFQSISVDVEHGSSVEKTAIDKLMRDDVGMITSASGTDVDKVLSPKTVSNGKVTEWQFVEQAPVEPYGESSSWTPVTIDTTDYRQNIRISNETAGSNINRDGSSTTGYTSSSVTSSISNAFACEKGKKYRLTITNGNTPAQIADRATVIVATIYSSKNYKVAECFRSTNTSNAKDVVEFTPNYDGYVFFNLDANFQSISVDEEHNTNTDTTAIDKYARENISRYVINNEVIPDLTFESGTFDNLLEDVSGSGYRSQIITGVKDCAICIKVDPTFTVMFGNGIESLVTIHGSFVYHSTRDAVRFWVSDTVANSGLEVRIYKERGHRGIYDVIVAASDSSNHDKLIADIVCDGVNDEVDLQFAVNWNFYRKIGNSSRDATNVLLLPGNYAIDNFEIKETLHGDDTVAQYAVMVGNDSFSGSSGYYYSASIEGTSDQGHLGSGAVARLNVTNTAVAT